MIKIIVKNKRLLILIGILIGLLIGIKWLYLQPTWHYYENGTFDQPSFIPSSVYSNPHMLRLPILLYHYVEYVKDKGDTIRQGLDVLPSTFEGHLKSLSDAHYTSYFVRDIPDILNGNIPFQPNSVILTFDDGYEDFYTDAYPLLKKYRVKTTIYVVNDFIGRPNYMTESQIREIAASNLVEIGSHSLNHLKLTTLTAAVAQKEIVESKQKLEKRFGISIKTFAYPYGSFSPELIALTKEASYSAAVSVVRGIDQSSDNLLFLSRIRAGGIGKTGLVPFIEKLESKEASSSTPITNSSGI